MKRYKLKDISFDLGVDPQILRNWLLDFDIKCERDDRNQRIFTYIIKEQLAKIKLLFDDGYKFDDIYYQINGFDKRQKIITEPQVHEEIENFLCEEEESLPEECYSAKSINFRFIGAVLGGFVFIATLVRGYKCRYIKIEPDNKPEDSEIDYPYPVYKPKFTSF